MAQSRLSTFSGAGGAHGFTAGDRSQFEKGVQNQSGWVFAPDGTWQPADASAKGYWVSKGRWSANKSGTDLNADIQTKFFSQLNQGLTSAQQDALEFTNQIGGDFRSLAGEARAGFPGELTATAPFDFSQLTPADIGATQFGESFFEPGTPQSNYLRDIFAGTLPFDIDPAVLEDAIRRNILDPSTKFLREDLIPSLEDVFVKAGGVSGSGFPREAAKLAADVGESATAQASAARLSDQQFIREAQLAAQRRPLTEGIPAVAAAQQFGSIPRLINQLGLDRAYAAWAAKFPQASQLLSGGLQAATTSFNMSETMLTDIFNRAAFTFKAEEEQKAARSQETFDWINAGINLIGAFTGADTDAGAGGTPATGTPTTPALGRPTQVPLAAPPAAPPAAPNPLGSPVRLPLQGGLETGQGTIRPDLASMFNPNQNTDPRKRYRFV